MPTPQPVRPQAARTKQHRTRWLRRVCGAFIAFAALVSGGMVAGDSPVAALPRGEAVSFEGGLTISNFVLPGGKRAYCVEVVMGEPTGQAWLAGRLSILPGVQHRLAQWNDPAGMRQMNYLIDRHGQTRDAWTSAAVQLTIWRMRENFLTGNPMLNQKIAVLNTSQKGRDLITRSNQLIADARAQAKAPTSAPEISGKLSIAPDPTGKPGRYRVAYPKGTVSLSAIGGVFVRNGEATIAVPSDVASARYVDIDPGAKQLKVSGTWETVGQAGWEAQLDVYNTTTAAGGTGQRVAVATGKSSKPRRTGKFAAVIASRPPASAPPVASSLAQPSAEVGGSMRDELIVQQRSETTLDMWPAATASFTAYLEPEVGAPKFDGSWKALMGEPYSAQQEDENTGQLLWHTWWANPQGQALRDNDGNPIPVADHTGNSTSGIAADGTAYPVAQLTETGEPVLNDAGTPTFHTIREPKLEERRDPRRWTEAELSAMTEDERCLAQPVFEETGIAVPGPGRYASSDVTVRSVGTIHWVERVFSRGQQVHAGECGIANETTRINQPGVVTQAPPNLVIGEEAFDTATVSGTLLPHMDYSIRFEAFRAPADSIDAGEVDAATSSEAPSCTTENLVFRSERIPVTAVGEIRSPGFTIDASHGVKLWWVETLEIDEGVGPRPLHRGVCGLANETTRIGQPAVETQAQASAVVGDDITDTATLSGQFATNDGARWELSFQGFQAEPFGKTGTPVCDASNLIFSVPSVVVEGPGQVTSAPVRTRPEWRGDVWWVETLWLIQDGERTAFATGACGIANETTSLEGPSVTTLALPLVTLGDAVTDTATVTGPLSSNPELRYELEFAAYRGESTHTGTAEARCHAGNLLWESDPIAVTAPGEVTSPALTALPAHGDTIWWVESLWQVDSGRASSSGSAPERLLISKGQCGVEHETTRVQRPSVATVATARVSVGEPLFDTAIVEGAFAQRNDIEYRVTFTAYARSADGSMSCQPGTEIPELSDEQGVVITEAGRYESRRVIARPEHVGLGGFVESLVMTVDGHEHLVHRGNCGAASENFEVVPGDVPPPPKRPDLPRTGGASGLMAAGAATLMLAVGGTFIARSALRRRRRES